MVMNKLSIATNKTYNTIIGYCTTQNINLTEQQSLVLKIVCQHVNPVAAHEILDNLKQINDTANRMTIHRALEHLNKIGVIHKISFNNTYVVCDHLEDHNCQLLVCTKCGKKTEVSSPEILLALQKSGEKHEFYISTPIEIMGYCKDCLN